MEVKSIKCESATDLKPIHECANFHLHQLLLSSLLLLTSLFLAYKMKNTCFYSSVEQL